MCGSVGPWSIQLMSELADAGGKSGVVLQSFSLWAGERIHHLHGAAAPEQFFFQKIPPNVTYLKMISASWGSF